MDFNIKTVDPKATYHQKMPVLAHCEFPARVLGSTWLVEKGETKLLVTLSNAFIATVKAPAIA